MKEITIAKKQNRMGRWKNYYYYYYYSNLPPLCQKLDQPSC